MKSSDYHVCNDLNLFTGLNRLPAQAVGVEIGSTSQEDSQPYSFEAIGEGTVVLPIDRIGYRALRLKDVYYAPNAPWSILGWKKLKHMRGTNLRRVKSEDERLQLVMDGDIPWFGTVKSRGWDYLYMLPRVAPELEQA